MGNTIGYITWSKSDNDGQHRRNLTSMAKNCGYGLSIEAGDNPYYPVDVVNDKTKNYFAVSVNGIDNTWFQYKVKLFLFDAQKYFEQHNIDSKTYYEFLPL